MGQWNTCGVMIALLYVETSIDSEDNESETVWQSNVELMQALVALSSAYSDGMTAAKIETNAIAQKWSTELQTIHTFS